MSNDGRKTLLLENRYHDRADAIAEAWAKTEPNRRITKIDVVRVALDLGLTQLAKTYPPE